MVLMGIGLLSGCRQNAATQAYRVVCDAETLTETGNEMMAPQDSLWQLKFGNAGARSTERPLHGKYGLKLDKEKPYGFTCNISGVHFDEYYRISVWRYDPSGTSKLVISGPDANQWYLTTGNGSHKRADGWEQLVLHVEIPPFLEGHSIKAYVWASAGQTAYFDDFTIEQLPARSYPEYEAEPLRLFIDTLKMQKLFALRDKAFQNGILESDDDSWVSAIVFSGDEMMKANVRLKGDWLDHLEGRKWSFRVKLKSAFAWKGMRVFSIQNPVSRNFLDEYVAHQIAQKEGVLNTRFGYVPVYLNGRSLGLYAYEEHFVKQLVESRNRREGPIVKFTEDAMWNSIRLEKSLGKKFLTPNFEAAAIVPFSSGKTIGTPGLKKQFEIASNLMYNYKNMLVPAHEIFDVEQLGKYYALIDLTKMYHGLVWHNQRFYCNPALSKLEPIAFDGYTENGVYKWVNRPLFGDFDGSSLPTMPGRDAMLLHLFEDPVFVDQYVKYLKKYSDEAFLQAMMKDLAPQVDELEAMIRQEFPFYSYQRDFLFENAKRIRAALPAYLQKIKNNRHYAAGVKQNRQIPVADSSYHPSIPAYQVKAYWQEREDEKVQLQVENYNGQEIILLGTGESEKYITHYFHPEPSVLPYYQEPFQVTAETDTLANYLFFMVKDHFETVCIPVYRWPAPDGRQIPRQKLMRQALQQEGRLFAIENQTVRFFEGTHKVEHDLVIPAGYQVIFPAGISLDFIGRSGFVSFSPVQMMGTQQQPIHILSSDSSARGFTVIDTPTKSHLRYVSFQGISNLDYDGWVTPSATAFLEADVDFDHCTFDRNSACDDALNVLSAHFNMTNSLFLNTMADAFDSDFCTGTLSHTRFVRPGNDAIDFSGSQIIISDCVIEAAADKGISGGEASCLTVINTQVTDCNIGVASKDRSQVYVQGGLVKDCKYGLVAFCKKPEYGPAEIHIDGTRFGDFEYPQLLETKSVLYLNRDTVVGTATDVAARFY